MLDLFNFFISCRVHALLTRSWAIGYEIAASTCIINFSMVCIFSRKNIQTNTQSSDFKKNTDMKGLQHTMNTLFLMPMQKDFLRIVERIFKQLKRRRRQQKQKGKGRKGATQKREKQKNDAKLLKQRLLRIKSIKYKKVVLIEIRIYQWIVFCNLSLIY